jgi:hypothetical protein
MAGRLHRAPARCRQCKRAVVLTRRLARCFATGARSSTASRRWSDSVFYEDLDGQTSCAWIRCLRGWPPSSNREDCAPVAGKRSIVWSTGRSETGAKYRKIDCIRQRWRRAGVILPADQIRARRVDSLARKPPVEKASPPSFCRGSASCAAPGQATRQFRDLRQQARAASARGAYDARRYLVAAAYWVSSLRMILPPFITNLTC